MTADTPVHWANQIPTLTILYQSDLDVGAKHGRPQNFKFTRCSFTNIHPASIRRSMDGDDTDRNGKMQTG